MLNTYAKHIAMMALAASSIAFANAQSVKGTIALPGQPAQLAVDVLCNRIYVAVPNFGALPYDYLTIIDGKTDTVIKTIQIPPVAVAVAVDPFKGLVYVGGTYQDSNGITQSQVAVVNAATDKVVKTIPVSTTPGDGILSLAVNDLNGNLYVSNGSDYEVDVISNFAVQSRIATTGEPYGIAVNPFLNNIYVARLDGNVSVISGKTNAITTTTPFGVSDVGIAADIVTGSVFTTNLVGYPNSGTVGAFNQAASLVATVPVGYSPFGIDVDFGTHLVFVANTQSSTVSVINGTTNAVTSTLPVSALFLAANSVTEKVYATSSSSAAVTVINEK
jgi:YVTN family beta-propeller protein